MGRNGNKIKNYTFRPIDYPASPSPTLIAKFMWSAANGTTKSDEIKIAAETTLEFLSDYDFPATDLATLFRALKEGESDHNKEVLVQLLSKMSCKVESTELSEDFLNSTCTQLVKKTYHILSIDEQKKLFEGSPQAFNKTKRQIEGKDHPRRCVRGGSGGSSDDGPLPDWD